MNKLCPCGSGKLFQECCDLIIQSKNEAETCEELMRSRYSAFTQANIDYLMRSHHSRTRPLKELKNIQKWAASIQWMGMVILKTEDGGANDDSGYVEFRALFLDNGKMDEIHEKSLFKRENGKWVYVSGEHF